MVGGGAVSCVPNWFHQTSDGFLLGLILAKHYLSLDFFLRTYVTSYTYPQNVAQGNRDGDTLNRGRRKIRLIESNVVI